MKQLLLTLVTILVLLSAGCFDNNLDPVSPEQLNKDMIDTQPHSSGVIPLEGILVNPGVPLTEYYTLNGSIIYDHRLLSGPDPIAEVSIDLIIKASIDESPGQSAGYLMSTYSKVVYVNELGYVLEVSFPLEGGHKDLTLVFSFLVTSEDIFLSRRWLETNS